MQIKKLISGKISVHPRGFGFVASSEGEDLFIPGSRLGGAIDGDFVTARVVRATAKGYEGEVVRIEKRKRTHIVGTVVSFLPKGDIAVFAPLVGENREIILDQKSCPPLEIGDRVSLNIVSSTEYEIRCSLHEVLGSIDNAMIDTKVAILEHGIRHEFPPEVIAEAKAFPEELKVDASRRDLTGLHTLTIDPVNARDYDDALSIERDGDGHYHLGVHIADVSHFVRVGSHLDLEAIERGNSTYFTDGVVPMLPEELSNNLCSLKEGVNRYVISALMHLDPHGKMLSYEIVRAVIRSRKRFTYEEAFELLESKKKSPHLKVLSLLVELCGHFKKERTQRKSVDLSLPEIRLVMGKDGVPTGEERVEYDITHQMVEEFMLKANELVATHLLKEGKKSIFRIHEEPSSENLEEFFTYARLLGFRIPAQPKEEDIYALFEMAQKSPYLEQLAVRYIRSMRLAIYSKDNVGHYGLALENYTHFTSPIRRYSDLAIHRLLFEKDYAPDLDKVAELCTQKERASFKAEMQTLRLKKLRYLDKLTDEDPNRTFHATLTSVKPMGIYFDLDFLGFEGFIHVSLLGNDYYIFDPKRHTFVGEKTSALFQAGQKLSVRLETIDLVYQECTWSLQPLNAKPTTVKTVLSKKPAAGGKKSPSRTPSSSSKKSSSAPIRKKANAATPPSKKKAASNKKEAPSKKRGRSSPPKKKAPKAPPKRKKS